MNQVELDIYISMDEYMAYYQGKAQSVFTHTLSGQSIQFPAGILRPYLQPGGVRGRFAITFDENGKLRGIRRID